MYSKSQTKQGEKSESSKKSEHTEDDPRPPIEQPTPIVITGGSPLTATSQVVAWRDWATVDDHRIRHPLVERKISAVTFKDDNDVANPTIALPVPANGKCTVTIVYALP